MPVPTPVTTTSGPGNWNHWKGEDKQLGKDRPNGLQEDTTTSGPRVEIPASLISTSPASPLTWIPFNDPSCCCYSKNNEGPKSSFSSRPLVDFQLTIAGIGQGDYGDAFWLDRWWDVVAGANGFPMTF